MRERTIKVQGSGRLKMTIDSAFKYFRIVGGREARNRMIKLKSTLINYTLKDQSKEYSE